MRGPFVVVRNYMGLRTQNEEKEMSELIYYEHKTEAFVRATFKTENKKDLHVTVWQSGTLSQIEIWTYGGKSFVAKGKAAMEFAQWLSANFVTPLLDPARENLADMLTRVIVENQGKGVPMRDIINEALVNL